MNNLIKQVGAWLNRHTIMRNRISVAVRGPDGTTYDVFAIDFIGAHEAAKKQAQSYTQPLAQIYPKPYVIEIDIKRSAL